MGESGMLVSTCCRQGSRVAPDVSFVMGVYCCKNPAELLCSVDSIVSQTFENWEFLIVDDGSPDNGATFAAIEAAAALDQRIIPLRYNENRGLSFALNYCLKHAGGRYIARQDDDDYSEPERLAMQVAFLELHPDLALVGTNAAIFDDDGEWGSLVMPEHPSRESFLWNSPFVHPSVVMRADALRSVDGYRVSPETVRSQDYDLFMRMYAAGWHGANLQEPLYRYRSSRDTLKYRSMPRRVQEAKIRARGFKAMGFGPSCFPYIIKPLLLGLVPKHIYGAVQNRRVSL